MKRILFVLMLMPAALLAQPSIELVDFSEGFSRPTNLINAGDDRLFLTLQEGYIIIMDREGVLEPDTFLNIASRVGNASAEKGLLGLAFAPDYCSSGKFYVNHTFIDSTNNDQFSTKIARYAVNPDDPNDALEDSEEVLLTFAQPFSNHNGGHIEFGADGYLYISVGDGGSGGDPTNQAQNLTTLLGKILRIDVSGDAYTIPADNPFANMSTALPEIWVYGLRNPWKFAFDELTDDLYMGDVGQNEIEEVDFQAASSNGGENYGWRCREGSVPYNTSQCGGITGLVNPVYEYEHSEEPGGCSITGGRVYRGKSFPTLHGRYIFGDYCSGNIWSLKQVNGAWQNTFDLSVSPNLIAFGKDVWGEMYAVINNPASVKRIKVVGEERIGHIYYTDLTTIESNLEGASYQWFQDGIEIDGENEQNLSLEEDGIYTVEITSAEGCTVLSDPFEVIALSANEWSNVKRFEIYPNPAQSEFRVDLELAAAEMINAELRLFDLSGRVVKELRRVMGDQSFTVDVSDLANGVYFLSLQAENGEIFATKKLVLN